MYASMRRMRPSGLPSFFSALLIIQVLRPTQQYAGHNVGISVDLGTTHDVSEELYGIFFEEINHAGEGGLYAELIQDRSFDALAFTTGFSESGTSSMELTPEMLQQSAVLHQKTTPPLSAAAQIGRSASIKQNLLREKVGFINQPVSWRPLSSTKVALTTADPVSSNNAVALNLTAFNPGGGIINSGYWGVPLNGGWIYHFSVYLKGDEGSKVQVLFKSADNDTAYGETTFKGIKGTWTKYSANITSNTTDFKAVVALRLLEPASVLVDSLSLFPGGNLREGWQNPYPFREDLLQLLKDLQPRFVRFPGGCYVEGGDWLKNRFPWKTNLGLYENRTGHLNDVWGYWSTDGLGLYEYMLLADELGAEPIYVVNNGISHQESTLPAELQPFLDETMDALEFLTGPPNSTWGAVRSLLARTKPWTIKYLAIGNEDCGRQYYIEDYNAFYGAIKAVYPDVTLIANCPMLQAAPTDLWDWHSYDDSWTMFSRMHQFDGMDRTTDPPVFVSEYAVTVDGGWGNLKGAVAEASFMTGLERNSDIVKLASYAPLFVHTENRIWPTNMIVIDNHRAYKTPAYLVQQLFSRFQGVTSAATTVETVAGDLHNELVAASATCQDRKCETLAVKASSCSRHSGVELHAIEEMKRKSGLHAARPRFVTISSKSETALPIVVNFDSYEQPVTISIRAGSDVSFEDAAVLHHVSGNHPEAENSFESPENVLLAKADIQLSGSTISGGFQFQVTLPPWSASVVELAKKLRPSASVV